MAAHDMRMQRAVLPAEPVSAAAAANPGCATPPASVLVPVQDGVGFPVDVLRLVLQQLLGEERQDAYRLMRDLQNFLLVCRTWRDVAFSTPLRINLDYLVNLKWEAVQWLLKATFADLQVHPHFHINRLLTNPDFATRNRWTLQRLWGAQLVGLPGRWPQWRHYPAIQTLELGCDSMASRNHVFESRLLAPLTQLKHLCLQDFESADLTRLPRTLRTLNVYVDSMLTLRLPEGLVLEDLSLEASRVLLDWGKLCKQVEGLVVIEAAFVDMVAGPRPAQSPPLELFRHIAAGFKEGVVREAELVAQEVYLVRMDGQMPRHIAEEDYTPDVLDFVDMVQLASDLQWNAFRDLGCVFDPDDLQTDEHLGMEEGVAVCLYRAEPGQPRTLGFSFDLQQDQLAFLVAEAEVASLDLQVPIEQAIQVLTHPDFSGRCAATLTSLKGLDLHPDMGLRAFSRLESLEGFFLNNDNGNQAVASLPPSLTCLDLCGVSLDFGDPLDPDCWPTFVAGPANGPNLSIAHLTALRDLSLRHFSEINLAQHVPTSLESITIECPRPFPSRLGQGEAPVHPAPDCACPVCAARLSEKRLAALRHCERFRVRLPPLPEGARRSVNIQLHRSGDYLVRRPCLSLSQFMQQATHVTISITADAAPGHDPGLGLGIDPFNPEDGDPDNFLPGGHHMGDSDNDSDSDNDGDSDNDSDGGNSDGGNSDGGNSDGGNSDGGNSDGGNSDDFDDFLGDNAAAAAIAAAAAAHHHQAASAARGATLLLAAEHGTLREALDALTASPLQSVDVDAPTVLFTDGGGERCTGAARALDFMRQAYGHAWLAWTHEPPSPEGSSSEEEGDSGDDSEDDSEGEEWGSRDGGFTMRRK